jgi:hypothetical protein
MHGVLYLKPVEFSISSTSPTSLNPYGAYLLWNPPSSSGAACTTPMAKYANARTRTFVVYSEYSEYSV